MSDLNNEQKTGKVKWFNNAKGYGFILADGSTEDLFAHYSTIQMQGYRTLKAGQTVQFDIEPSEKGSHAVNIRCLSDSMGEPDQVGLHNEHQTRSNQTAESMGVTANKEDALEPTA